jgi:hypothetical protein
MTYLDTSSAIGEHLNYLYKVSVGGLDRVAAIIQA